MGGITDYDAYVGTRLRSARVSAGISQSDVAHKLGVTFQQIQKYEKGVNRISAGKIQAVAELCRVPISYFYKPEGSVSAGLAADEAEFLGSRDGAAMVAAFAKINARQKRLLSALAQEFAGGGGTHV